MTVSFVNRATVTTGVVDVVAANPATVTAGNLLLLVATGKYPRVAQTPAGYTAPPNNVITHGTNSPGVDAGSMTTAVFYKIATGSEGGTTTTVSYSGSTTDSSLAATIVQFSENTGNGFDLKVDGGADTTADATWSVTGTSTDYASGDLVWFMTSIPTDAPTIDTISVSGSGLTFGSAITGQSAWFGSGAGSDNGTRTDLYPITAGTATGPVTYTGTVSVSTTNAVGVTVFVRLRSLVLTQTVTATGIGPGEVFGTATVTAPVVVEWPGYDNAFAGPITVTQAVTLAGWAIGPTGALGTPVVALGTPSPPPPAPPPPPPPPLPPAPPAPPVPLPVAYLPLPPSREVLVEVRAPDLTRVGMIDLRDIVDFRAVLRYQNLGSWSMRLQPDHPLSTWLSTPKAGIIASLDGEVLFSGPVDGGNNYRSREVVNGRMVYTGVDDSYVLGDALAYPQPSNSNASTQSVAYDTRTGAAETVMHAYVNANIGPSSPVARRITNLTMAANLGRGQTVTHKARFEILGEVLESIGKLAGLGFRVRQNGLTRQFEVYQPRDLTAAIRFDIFNNTLVSHEYGWGVHKVSRAIVAGGGEGTARVIVERSNADSLAAESLWGRRIERFIDQRQTEELAELQQAGDEALVEDGKTRTGLEIEPVDTYQVQFARDYYLGDKVTVTVDGIEIQDTITEVEITLDKNGLNAKPTLGQLTTISRHAQLRILASQHEQARRLSGLERKV